MSNGATADLIICIVAIVTDIDGCAVVATEEEKEINIDTSVLAFVCSIESIGCIECSDTNHSKLVTCDLSRDAVASNEKITPNSGFVICVDII